jgi:2'-5' RNA ligase
VSPGSERARLFVALDLPLCVREALVRWRTAAIRDQDGLRVLGPDALHVTLCFLGWRAVDEIEAIAGACAAALTGSTAPTLTLNEPLWLPARRPRVLAVGLTDPSGGLGRIQARVSAALSEGGWYTPEARPFLAHVTVARVAGRARVRAAQLEPPDAREFPGAGVTLYRSRLERSGARYEALRTIEL